LVKPREGVRLVEFYEEQMRSKTYLNIERTPKRKPKAKAKAAGGARSGAGTKSGGSHGSHS